MIMSSLDYLYWQEFTWQELFTWLPDKDFLIVTSVAYKWIISIGSPQRKSQFNCKYYHNILDAKISVKWPCRWREKIWKHRHLFVCSCSGRCKHISGLSLEPALCCASVALTQGRCNSPGRMCVGLSLIWTVAVQLLGHRSAQPLSTWWSCWGADKEQRQISWPVIHIPTDKSHCLFSEGFAHAVKKKKLPGFYCIGYGGTVCFKPGAYYSIGRQ